MTIQRFHCGTCQKEHLITEEQGKRIMVPDGWYYLLAGLAYQDNDAHKLLFCSVVCLLAYPSSFSEGYKK